MPLGKDLPSSAKASSSNRSNMLPSSKKPSTGAVQSSSSRAIKTPSKTATAKASSVIDSNNNNNKIEPLPAFETKHIPMSKEPPGLYNIVMTDSDMALAKRKFVKVSSVGEVEVSPDKVEFCIQIVCSRKDAQAARQSAHKRYEFLRLALQKLNIDPREIITTSVVKRYKVGDEVEASDDLLEKKILHDARKEMGLDGNSLLSREAANSDSSYISYTSNSKAEEDEHLLNSDRMKVVQELYVKCDNLNQYMELFSIVNERLDRQVIVSPPIFRISPEHLQVETREAAKLAMANAIYKAQQILQSHKLLKASVGKLFYSMEDSLTVQDVVEYQSISTSTTFDNLNWKRNNKLIVCKLTSMFEVNTVKGNRKTF